MTSRSTAVATGRASGTTPAGARLNVSAWGRDFRLIDIDRWRITDWPEQARPELERLARHLSTLAVYYRRDRCVFLSHFISSATVYAPRAVAVELVEVLLSAEHGDTSQVTPIADLAEQAAATVTAEKGVGRRAKAARPAVAWFVAQVKARQR